MTLPTECFYYLISRATLIATTALRRELAEAGVGKIRASYLGVLMALWNEDGLKSSTLGRRAGLGPSSMTGVLDRMERDGLINREADPNDRRVQRIVLTDQGGRAEKPVLAVVDRMLDQVTGDIPKEDIEVTKATLKKLLDLAQKEHR